MPLLQTSLMNPIVTDYHKMSHVSQLSESRIVAGYHEVRGFQFYIGIHSTNF